MTKLDFLELLRKKLSHLACVSADEHVEFYSEMIDDRIEDGLSEEEAVLAMGDIDGIVSQIIVQTPITKIIRERIKPKRRPSTLEIVLLSIGSPIWLSLLISALAVIFCAVVSLWALAVSFAALPISLAATGVALPVFGIGFVCFGHRASGLATLGVGLVCLGLFIFGVILAKALFKGTFIATKGMVSGLKRVLVKKGEER